MTDSPTSPTPGDEVEPYVFDAEIVDDEPESADAPERPGRLVAVRAQGAHIVTTLGSSSAVARTARVARKSARAGWTTGQGAYSGWLRAWRAATHGHLREQVRLARVAGDRVALGEWSDRLETAKNNRAKRIKELPGEVFGAARLTAFGLVGLGALLVVGGLTVAVSPGGATWSTWWAGVGALLDTSGAALGWTWWTFTLAVGPMLVWAAWQEGKRAADPPLWLLTAEERAEQSITIDERAISLALANLGNSALARFAKEGGKLQYVVPARADGNGTFAQVRLPLGVSVDDVNRQRKRFAGNLQRAALEVWATTDERYDDEGLMDVWIANKGALRAGVGDWPLLHDGVVDAFEGVPVGRTQRGDEVSAPLFESNYLVGGKPGQGKSAAMRALLLGASLDPTAELMVFVMGESPDFRPFGPRLARYAMGMDDAVAEQATQALRDLLAEMERRGKVLGGLPGTPPKTSRKLADKPGLGLHIIVCGIDECHELFMHPTFGAEAAALAVRLIKRGRKYGIVLVLATQSPTADSIPRDVTRNVSCGVAFAVGDHIANDGLLGQGRYKAGVRATELRAGRDRGTSVTVGLTDNTFELVRWFYVPFEDGRDEVTPVIKRAMAAVGELRRTGATTAAAIEAPADPLADLFDALREDDTVRTGVLLGRLREADPATYVPLTARSFAELLDGEEGLGVPIRKRQGGNSVVCRDDVQRALSDRDEEGQ